MTKEEKALIDKLSKMEFPEYEKELNVLLETYDFETTNCPLVEEMECRSLLAQKALDLITRQQSEIERLQNILMCFIGALGKVRKIDDIDEISLIPLMSELNKQYRAELKAEAYKEFAERLKRNTRKMSSSDFGGEFWDKAVLVSDIDNLVKEMANNNKD